jgi:NADPH:quinone reductase-like Zn-dependent oxidoreductase
MRAVQMKAHGGYGELRPADLPDPVAAAGDVLVRVGAAGVTPLDRTVLAGLLPTAAGPPLILGNEGAGAVVEDPSGTFRPGERVVFFAGAGGVTRDGTYAELTLVPVGFLARLPEEISDELAAGLPTAYLSAFLALRQAGFRAGDSVFAPGVGGSVGNATLKVAGALGASRLLSTAGSEAKVAAARADAGLAGVKIIELGAESVADGLKRLAPEGVDVIVDAVGGPLTGQAISGLARGGRAVVMGYVAGTTTEVTITDLVWKRATLAGFSLFASTERQQTEAYRTLLPMIADGSIRPARDRSYALNEAGEALRHLTEDRPFGKVTLAVAPT